MKLALLGLKGHVSAVVAGAKLLGDVAIVAVSDNNLKAADAFLKRLPQPHAAQAYAQWQHVLEHTMPDVCCVADETGMRLEQLLALLERGIHIISEKPLVTTLADLEKVRAAFAKSKSQLTMLLELRGYSVVSALNVRTAVELAGRHEIDVLISDLGLPDGNAGEAMHEVATRYSAVGIALSGFGMEEDMRASRDHGFDYHLVKPVEVGRLESILREIATHPRAAAGLLAPVTVDAP